MLLTPKKLHHGPQQHFLEDSGLGCQHSQCGTLAGHTETCRSQGPKTAVIFWHANTHSNLMTANLTHEPTNVPLVVVGFEPSAAPVVPMTSAPGNPAAASVCPLAVPVA